MAPTPSFCGTLERVRSFEKNDLIDYDSRREGYVETRSKFVPVVDVSKPVKKQPSQGNAASIRSEERLGSLIAAAGTAWLVYVATTDFNNMWQMRIMPPGPLEVCALGILLWLHAKWRRSIKN
jgi:hypothetical protein